MTSRAFVVCVQLLMRKENHAPRRGKLGRTVSAESIPPSATLHCLAARAAMATSHASLVALLDGLDAATLGTLARNDIRSIDDLQALSPEDIKELGLSVGHRNRLRRRIATSYTAASGHAAAGAGTTVAAELSSDGEHVTSCGPSCLRFALDEQPQACAAAGTHGSNRTTAAEVTCP